MPSRKPYHHGDLRNALAMAAVELIERDGQNDFSLRGAARNVGVSANAAYRHFSDKSALLTAVAQHGFAQLSQRMRRAIKASRASGQPAEAAVARFKATGRAYVEFALAHPELFDVMFGPHGAACIVPGSSPDGEQSPYELLGAALDGLVDTGVMTADARTGAELKAWTVVHGFARLCLDGAARMPSAAAQARALESVLDFAVNGLCGR